MMTFDEWYKQHYEVLKMDDWEGNCPLYFELDDMKDAFEGGLHADVHTDSSAIIEKLQEENEQLKSRLDKAIECIKNIEEENKKLVQSNNLAERFVNMIPKIEYMSKEHKKLVVLEAEQYIKGVR